MYVVYIYIYTHIYIYSCCYMRSNNQRNPERFGTNYGPGRAGQQGHQPGRGENRRAVSREREDSDSILSTIRRIFGGREDSGERSEDLFAGAEQTVWRSPRERISATDIIQTVEEAMRARSSESV